MEAIARQMMEAMVKNYKGDFIIGKVAMIDELSGREYYLLSYTAKDLPVPYEGSVATHGKFFPRDAKGVRALIVFIVDEDNDEAMDVRAERVSEDGQVLEAVRHFWSPDVDWQTLCVWQEHYDRAEAMIDDAIKRGHILLC